jgi:hypothetical protein
MKTYVVTMYVSIEAETEEEAREIAFTLDVVPKNEADKEKIFYMRKIQKLMNHWCNRFLEQ